MYLGEAPTPTPAANELLVKVHATALNRADVLQRKGFYPPPPGASEVIGLEVAGTVEAVGPQCRTYQPGDQVFALLPGGGYAEYVTLPEVLAIPVPEKLSLIEAAAIAEVYLTAFQALKWLGNVQAHDQVLIHAGASGVGTAAIQLTRLFRGTPYVTAGSTAKIDFCKSLGAVAGINYKEEAFAERLLELTNGHGADVVLDFIGASYLQGNMQAIAADGRWVVLGLMGGLKADGFDMGTLLRKRIQLKGSTLRARSLDYKEALVQAFTTTCLPHFDTGLLRPVVDKVMPWQQVAEAHQYMEANKNMGKIVLQVAGS